MRMHSSGSSSDGAAPDWVNDPRIKMELRAEAARAQASVPTFGQRQKRGKRQKNPAYKPKRSRQARYAKLKKPVRDSKRVYNIRHMRAKFMNAFLQLPSVRDALEGLRSAQLCPGNSMNSPEVIVIDGDEPVGWPDDVEEIKESRTAEEEEDPILFPDIGETDPCECSYDCFRNVCINARTGYYCTPSNCHLDGRCSNSVHECNDVQLVDTGLAGLGVIATATINVGSVIGNYCGELTTHDFEADKEQTSEYALEIQTKSTQKKTVYIEATKCGGISRFINHSCRPNTEFVEMFHRDDVRVLVIATKKINAGDPVTVDYGPDLWFTCMCGEDNCRSKKQAMK